MGLQTWQYLLGITYADTSNSNSVYSSDFQYNQSMSLADSRQSLNSSVSQNSLSEAQNEILSTIENHFKMLNDKLQKKEQMENYLGIIIGFTSLTSSFLISIPFSVIRNRNRALSLVSPNEREIIRFYNNFEDFPEGRLLMESCCENLLCQGCFTLTEDIVNSVKKLFEDPKDKKKEEKLKKLKMKKEKESQDNKSLFIKTIITKSFGYIISYPMYKSYICHPINYPRNMLQNYQDIFSSIKKQIINSFIRDNFKSKTQGVLTRASPSSSLTATSKSSSLSNKSLFFNKTLPSFISSSSLPSSIDHSYLEKMPVIDTTRWYSKFFTTVFYWISYDLIEILIYKSITRLYFHNDNNSRKKKAKELQRKPIPSHSNRPSNQNQNQNQNDPEDQNNQQNDIDENGLPPSVPNTSNSTTSPQDPSTSSNVNNNNNNNNSNSNSNKEQRPNSGRSPQHTKIMKVSTTMLKRVYIDVFCRLASSILTKVITYPLDTVCVKLLTNGTEVKAHYRPTSTSASFPISEGYPLLNKDIHGFWSCCKTIYQSKGILGFYENFLYGMIPEIIFNTVILEMTYYATNYLLKYVDSKYEIIPKSKHRHRKKK